MRVTDIEDQIRRYVAARSRTERPVELSEISVRRRSRVRAPLLSGIAAALCAVLVAGFVIVGSADHHRTDVGVSSATTRPSTSVPPVPTCPAESLAVTSTRGERLHPDYLPAGFVLTEGSETDLGPRGQLTYTPTGGGDPPRVELLRYHTTEALSALSEGSHHAATVRGRPAVFSNGAPDPAFSSVAWMYASDTALVVSGYKLSEIDVLAVADGVRYQPGTTFTYPTRPHVGITRAQALAKLPDSQRGRAVLSSLGEVDSIVRPTGSLNHQPTIANGIAVTTPVWVVWNTSSTSPSPFASDAEVIDADSGERIATLPGREDDTLTHLTDRSGSSCEPPFGVLTRSEILSLRPAETGVAQTATLTTLARFASTSVGEGFAQCILATCDPNVPVWMLTSTAPDQRFTNQESGPLASRPTSRAGSWQVIAYDARTGPQDTEISSGGVTLGSGAPPADLATIRDLTQP
jgi:hypothetical protein